ncbi:hypothetical protein BH23CHL1_BH23CHL1_03780 [soil metagenome]
MNRAATLDDNPLLWISGGQLSISIYTKGLDST